SFRVFLNSFTESKRFSSPTWAVCTASFAAAELATRNSLTALTARMRSFLSASNRRPYWRSLSLSNCRKIGSIPGIAGVTTAGWACAAPPHSVGSRIHAAGRLTVRSQPQVAAAHQVHDQHDHQ